MASVTSSSLEDSVDATLSILRAEAPQRRAQPFTIFRVPAYVREANRSAYEPRMVSIGPYYHGAAALCAMEDHKWRYLHDLMSRNAAVSWSVMIHGSRGVMEIPLLEIDDMKAPLLGKLMAFEQSQSGGNARVLTGYVWLMSMLVRTADDVALLRRSGIWSSERTNEEMALFFSQLGHGAAIMNYDDWLFGGLCREVARYSSSWRRRNRAALKRTELMTIYFRSPWSIISVILLTAAQTYYAVFPKK